MRFAGLVLLAALALTAPAAADPTQNGPWHHATSLIGEPKYPEGFKHYDYVNPDAPKGGVARLSAMGSFDTFNPILPQGEPERRTRAHNMLAQMDNEGFGSCTNTQACEAVCPKGISMTNIAKLNAEYILAGLSERS